MGGALKGIRVVELSTMITAPLAGMMLADLGADVIKVERPEGDPFRSYGGGNYSAQYVSYNRNKRSVVLDLQAQPGKEALAELIVRADVLLENFRPGVLERLGFSAKRLAELNRRLIHCSITGFGTSGPRASRASYDAIAQAVSGMSSQFLDPDNPRLSGITIPDNVTGHYAAHGIMAALFERERTGTARRVEVNMFESAIAFMPEPFGYYTQNGEIADAYLRIRNSQAFVFTCGDGRMIATHLSSQQKFWERLTGCLDVGELCEHPDYATVPARVKNYEDLARRLAAVIRLRPSDAWVARFEEWDIPVAVVADIPGVLRDEQAVHAGTFTTVEHPQKGALTTIRRPVTFDGKRDDQPLVPPPMLGEHTQEVLAELGLA
jgi:formyl-CoA transferase